MAPLTLVNFWSLRFPALVTTLGMGFINVLMPSIAVGNGGKGSGLGRTQAVVLELELIGLLSWIGNLTLASRDLSLTCIPQIHL